MLWPYLFCSSSPPLPGLLLTFLLGVLVVDTTWALFAAVGLLLRAADLGGGLDACVTAINGEERAELGETLGRLLLLLVLVLV